MAISGGAGKVRWRSRCGRWPVSEAPPPHLPRRIAEAGQVRAEGVLLSIVLAARPRDHRRSHPTFAKSVFLVLIASSRALNSARLSSASPEFG